MRARDRSLCAAGFYFDRMLATWDAWSAGDLQLLTDHTGIATRSSHSAGLCQCGQAEQLRGTLLLRQRDCALAAVPEGRSFGSACPDRRRRPPGCLEPTGPALRVAASALRQAAYNAACRACAHSEGRARADAFLVALLCDGVQLCLVLRASCQGAGQVSNGLAKTTGRGNTRGEHRHTASLACEHRGCQDRQGLEAATASQTSGKVE